MPSGIAFPMDLPVVSRPGHGDMFEEIRSSFEPEVGVARRRNRMRVAPRIFDIQLDLSQDEFSIFDYWWQDTILGGEKEFDIQLLNDDNVLVWYTVNVLGEYSADVTKTMDWIVSFKVRAKLDAFGTIRVPGTDTLAGTADVGLSSTSGGLLAYTPFYGSGTIDLTATGEFNITGLLGAADVGLYWVPWGKLQITLAGTGDVGVESANGNLQVGP